MCFIFQTNISKISILLLLLLIGVHVDNGKAFGGPNPQEILSNADRARGNVEGIEWVIKLESVENKRKQENIIRIKARDNNSLAEFISPPKVKGRKMLMIDRNMWFVKPGLRKPVPISPRQKLMGGAAYGDIASTNYAGDYDPISMTEDTVNGEPCYLLDLKAVNKKVTYDRIKYWVSKEQLVGVKSEFFTVSGKIFKSATFKYNNEIQIDNSSRPFVSKMIITDVIIKSNITTMKYDEVIVKPIPDSTFNLNLLLR
jgi:hypothetical protein